MKIKLIAEGSTKWQRYIKRWGISFLIGDDVLFDTFGDARVFIHNIKKFNIDLFKIKHIIISHDHWDHIAGLWTVIEKFKAPTIYIGKDFSIDFKKRLKTFEMNVVEVNGSVEIKEDIYSTGQILGKHAGDVIYEQSIVIKSENGLTLITGCAHPNISNIVSVVKESLGEVPYTVIGGLHLKDESSERVKDIIKKLRSIGVNKIYPLHCSGQKAKIEIKEQFNEKHILKEGQCLEL